MKTIYYKIALFCFTAFALNACDSDSEQKLEHRNWKLVWSDEFEGTLGTQPDASKWIYDIGTGTDGWGNLELQYYTDRGENIALDGTGNLVITAQKESFAGSSYTSARIKTEGLFQPKYGRIEARIKTPYGPGVWPAFWMLGSDANEIGWPKCGEIDIMELKGNAPNIIHGTLHGPGYSAGNAITKMFAFRNERFDTDFHIFAIEWYEDRIDFFVDKFLFQRVNASDVHGEWVFNYNFFIILNLAIGGNFVGFPTEGTYFPQKLTVDYVRVYELVQ